VKLRARGRPACGVGRVCVSVWWPVWLCKSGESHCEFAPQLFQRARGGGITSAKLFCVRRDLLRAAFCNVIIIALGRLQLHGDRGDHADKCFDVGANPTPTHLLASTGTRSVQIWVLCKSLLVISHGTKQAVFLFIASTQY
jgi:hypothetical protein